MKILGIDTTKRSAKIFIIDTKEIEESTYLELNENIKHSEGLFLHIEKLLMESNVNISSLDGFACVVGPGSFTGIRVGMATIKGLNKVLNKSVVSMNSFEVLSKNIKNGLILLNSTMTSCYYARVKNSELVETGVVDKKDIPQLAQGEEIVILKEEQESIGVEYNNYKVVDTLSKLYINCVIDKLNKDQFGEFAPYYLQLSQAERNMGNVE